jgi:hypothetical protein
MRIIITRDQFWPCHKLGAPILRRLVARYGPGIVIVHGDDTGVEESYATAVKGLRITTEAHPVDFDHLGDGAEPFRNREMVRAGAELCIVVHRLLAASRGVKDCAREAIAAGIPTYLIDSEEAVPRRMRSGYPGPESLTEMIPPADS